MIHGGDITTYEQKYGKKPIDFSANISPIPIPSKIRESIVSSIDLMVNYPDPLCRNLCKAISLKENLDQKFVLAGNGASDLIYRLVLAKKPKKAMVLAPTFAEYEQALNIVDCDIFYYNLKEENDYNVTNDILNYIDETLDMIIICQPNNPTGQICEKKLLQFILEKCNKNKILMMIDECFIDFLEEEKEYSMVDFVRCNSNLFILKAFTKMYSLAGVRLGYCLCSNEELLDKMSVMGQPWSVSTIAQNCGITALSLDDHVNKVLDIIKIEREYLLTNLSRLNFKTYNSYTNYILFKSLDVKLDIKLSEKGFMIRNCSNYHNLGEGYFRIAVKNNEENVLLINALESLVNENG